MSAWVASHSERPRRLRRTPAMRRLVRETTLTAAQLVQPLFHREGLVDPVPVSSMPGVSQLPIGHLRRDAAAAVEAGVGGIMLFAVPERRDARGSAALDPHGPLARAVAAVKEEVGSDSVVMADLCLDEFTDHGHCGVLGPDAHVDNDETLARYATMARVLASAGVDVVAPSGMMDGQVAAVREALDDDGRSDVAILAYAAKFASVLYGPFRDAVDSTLEGDRRTYQQDPGNGREARRELRLDLAEGADMVMVKPAGQYLDVIADAAAASDVPVAAYQVSGEYAMIRAAADAGWLDLDAAVDESLLCIRRAGADVVLSYWATTAARRWQRRDAGPGRATMDPMGAAT